MKNQIRTFGKVVTITGIAASVCFALPKSSELVSDMGLGYNIGNTMEVPSNPTAWGNPFPDAAYVKAIKAAGFGTVRIPCAWDSHASGGTINAGWLDSVKTVVDLVINNGMYAILNSHWDNGWLEDHVFDGEGYDKTGLVTSSAATVATKQQNYWKQIADKFKEYDEHLIFASANEPGVNDPWNGGADNGQWAFDATRMQVLKQFHEACIKGVRSSGGNNATRTIVVQMPRTEIDKYELLANNYPADEAGNGYTMAEAHFYPYQLTLMTADEDWGGVFYYWEDVTTGDTKRTCSGTTLGSKKSIDSQFDKLKNAFTSKGIPVVIGEMGSIKRLNALTGDNLKKHLEARAAWYGYTVKSAKERGIIPCVWDTGDEGDGNFTIIRRQTNKFGGNVGDIVDVETLNSMLTAYGQATYEGQSNLDSLVQASTDESNKMLEVTYTSKTADSSETGTIRINMKSAKWSDYVAISFDAKINVESAGPCTDETKEGCNGSAWATVATFVMSGDKWDWADYNFDASEIDAGWKTYKLAIGADGLNIQNKDAVNAFGINVYGPQVGGTIDLDNILLYKADGSTVVLQNFDKTNASLEGTASGKLVTSTAPANGSTAINPVRSLATSTLVRNGNMLVSSKAIQLFDLSGKLVRTANDGVTTTMSLEGIHQGLYIAKSGTSMLKVMLK